jgi:EF hand
MKAIKPLLLGVSILALACGAAYAGGDAKNKSASAGASTSTKYDFNKADTNHDGKVSRAEFDAMLKANASGGSTSSGKTSSSSKSSTKPSTSSR